MGIKMRTSFDGRHNHHDDIDLRGVLSIRAGCRVSGHGKADPRTGQRRAGAMLARQRGVRMRTVRALHDLALALMTGGIVGVGLSVSVLFARAPSRDVAGQIGGGIFGAVGPYVLLLGSIVCGARLLMRTTEPASRVGLFATAASALVVIIAALNVFWLTPRMRLIWESASHAADGSGLQGEPRREFLALHGLSNLAYLSILLIGLLLILLRPKEPEQR